MTINDKETPDDEDDQEMDPANTGGTAVQQIKELLQNAESLAVNEEFIELFYRYQIESGPYQIYELRLLPDFSSRSTPDWDQLSQYIFLLSDQIERDDEGIYTLMKKAFEETVGRYFAKLDYTHKSSGFLHLVGDKYTPTGWDVTGRTYYRLCGLSEIDEGIFRAAFDGFSFDEFDDFGQPDIYISKNMEALIKYAGDNNDNISRDDILLEIFKDSRYSEILHRNEQLEITFKLSPDQRNAFLFLSCKRIISDE